MVVFLSASVRMRMRMRMRVSVSIGTGLIRSDRMRNQVEKGVAQQSSRGETEQNLQEWFVFRRIVDANEHQNDDRSQTDRHGRAQRPADH